jgi:hypothetical protein
MRNPESESTNEAAENLDFSPYFKGKLLELMNVYQDNGVLVTQAHLIAVVEIFRVAKEIFNAFNNNDYKQVRKLLINNGYPGEINDERISGNGGYIRGFIGNATGKRIGRVMDFHNDPVVLKVGHLSYWNLTREVL